MGCGGGGEKHGKGRYEGKDVCFDFGEVFWHGIENQYTDNFLVVLLSSKLTKR
jgi:hypothetical protein